MMKLPFNVIIVGKVEREKNKSQCSSRVTRNTSTEPHSSGLNPALLPTN